MERFPADSDICKYNPLAQTERKLAFVLGIDTTGLINGDIFTVIQEEPEGIVILARQTADTIRRAIGSIDKISLCCYDERVAEARKTLEDWLAALS